MASVSIDFVAGSHGHFLEYICNKYIAQIPAEFSPFTNLGSSHNVNKQYLRDLVFEAKHFSEMGIPKKSNVVRIIFDQEDLLVLSAVSLLRAGDSNINNNDLENDTYNKLNSPYYKNLIYEINAAYPDNQISVNHPNCPRYILREFFKFGFRDSQVHGFFDKLKQITRAKNSNVFDFAFKNFYNRKMFLESINNLAVWYNGLSIPQEPIAEVHREFLERNPYVGYKEVCDRIIDDVLSKTKSELPALSLFQESYINGCLERMFPNLEMPYIQPVYFKNTLDIINYITCSQSKH